MLACSLFRASSIISDVLRQCLLLHTCLAAVRHEYLLHCSYLSAVRRLCLLHSSCYVGSVLSRVGICFRFFYASVMSSASICYTRRACIRVVHRSCGTYPFVPQFVRHQRLFHFSRFGAACHHCLLRLFVPHHCPCVPAAPIFVPRCYPLSALHDDTHFSVPGK